jgi:hypothetical protein
MQNLDLRIGNESLELRPGTVLEFERNNPFLQFSDEVVGDFSLPAEIDLTPKNNRLINHAGLIQTRVDTAGIDARLHANGIQHSIGKIKVEKPSHNLNRSSDGTVSIYYLSGVASFYQDIKDKMLQQVNLGGDRVFAWDSGSLSTFDINGNGFWGHIHKVIDNPVNSYDYAFYPVINKSFTNIKGSPSIMNNMFYNPSEDRVKFNHLTNDHADINIIVPFPYLHYVLNKAVAHVGWKVEGTILNDPDFLKITIVNFTGINWGLFPGPLFGVFGFPSVSFNLINHVPDISIGAFLIALKNRFGWWLDFDRVTKTIKIRTLQDVAIGDRKDMTKYASPVVQKSVANQKKIYALKNNYDGDYKDGQPDFTKVNLVGSLAHFADLPAAGLPAYGQAYLIMSENNYYICRQDDNDGLIKWMLLSYNVFDVLPPGNNEEITTDCVTLGMENYVDDLNYQDFLPRMDQVGGIEGSGDEVDITKVIVLFYHGRCRNKLNQPIPFGSSNLYDSHGNQVANWSLAFQCKKIDGTDVGLYDLYWKKLLARISVSETFQLTLYLPLMEYLNLKFSDIINIANVNMYITKVKERIPYDGSVDLEAVRS